MGKVYLGRLEGEGGFARTVAVKQLRFGADDSEAAATLLDEARILSRVEHPNVVRPLDVVREADELYLVMDHVLGVTLSELMQSRRHAIAPEVSVTIMVGVLRGLQAAHVATDERGESLGIVHRDVSPHNILLGADGIVRLLDFGVAKARGRLQSTQGSRLKGKLAYMSPEQLRSEPVGPPSDVFAAGICLWEALTGQRLFSSDNPAALLAAVLEAPIADPRVYSPELSTAVAETTLRALARDPRQRFHSAEAFADALEQAMTPLTPRRLSQWLEQEVGGLLDERRSQALFPRAQASPVTDAVEPAREAVRHAGPNEPTLSEDAPPTFGPNASTVPPDSEAGPRVSRTRLTISLVGLLLLGGASIWGMTTLNAAQVRSRLRAGMAPGVVPTTSSVASGAAVTAPPPTSSVVPSSSAPSAEQATPATPSRRKPARGAPVPRPQHNSCKPPYVVGADGIRRLKPECIQ